MCVIYRHSHWIILVYVLVCEYTRVVQVQLNACIHSSHHDGRGCPWSTYKTTVYYWFNFNIVSTESRLLLHNLFSFFFSQPTTIQDGWMDACVPCINLYTFTFSPENEVSKIVLLLVLLHWNGMDCFCVRKLAKLVVFLPFPPLHSSPSTTFFLGARSSFSLSPFLLIILVHSKWMGCENERFVQWFDIIVCFCCGLCVPRKKKKKGTKDNRALDVAELSANVVWLNRVELLFCSGRTSLVISVPFPRIRISSNFVFPKLGGFSGKRRGLPSVGHSSPGSLYHWTLQVFSLLLFSSLESPFPFDR